MKNQNNTNKGYPDQKNVTGHQQLLTHVISLFCNQFVESKCMKRNELLKMTSLTSME